MHNFIQEFLLLYIVVTVLIIKYWIGVVCYSNIYIGSWGQGCDLLHKVWPFACPFLFYSNLPCVYLLKTLKNNSLFTLYKH